MPIRPYSAEWRWFAIGLLLLACERLTPRRDPNAPGFLVEIKKPIDYITRYIPS